MDNALYDSSNFSYRGFVIFYASVCFIFFILFVLKFLRMQKFFVDYTKKAQKLYSFILYEIENKFSIFNKIKLNFNYISNFIKSITSISSYFLTNNSYNKKVFFF